MKKPNFLKTRKEKREDQLVRLTVLTTELAVALEEKKKRDAMEELEIETMRLEIENRELKNQLLRLQAEREKRELDKKL
jgi:hypothetical protein